MDSEATTRRIKASDVAVRPAADADLERLNRIYNEYVISTHYTFDLEPITLEERSEWFTHYGTAGRYRVLVAVAAEAVIGYTSSSRYRLKAGYDTSVETSVYLAADATGIGLGTRLYEALFSALRREDVHRAYSGIALPNPASLAIHDQFGFKKVAHFTQQGRKFDRYWDVAWFEKPLGSG